MITSLLPALQMFLMLSAGNMDRQRHLLASIFGVNHIADLMKRRRSNRNVKTTLPNDVAILC